MSKIFQAMAEVMKDIDAVGKNQRNQQQGFKFRGIDDVYNSVHPILAKHGVFTVPTVINEKTEERTTKNGGNLIYRILTIKYTFYADDGSFFEATVIGEGMDSGDKGANKAMAIAHKYALLQTLCIPTEDMIDPDSEVQEPSSPKRPASPKGAPPKKNEKPKEKKPLSPILLKELFTVQRAWNHIVHICEGNEDKAKGMFQAFGADTSEKITYKIYEDVYNTLNGAPVDAPEMFTGDKL